ncbi:MAG: homoserine dehydrogenase [Acidobacteria bacterium]|nr:homoserine dehydrogenase [Acidobacteriota bacterium]
MASVKLGIIGLGNVGSGTLKILTENGAQIADKLGFPLEVATVCARGFEGKTIPVAARQSTDWRDVVNDPDVHVVAELVGGTTVAREIVETALESGKSVVTANKELMALCGPELWEKAIQKGVNLAMEASVAGGIPIHTVLREGISGDRIVALYGILNGTSNYILTEIENSGAAFDDVLAEAQRLGYAEADPTADVDGFDARSKLAILSALAFGQKIEAKNIFTMGIRRITPIDFEYAHTLKHTIRLVCGARLTPEGLILSVRPALIPQSTILASVKGAYNAVWVRGKYGQDTFYYGCGAGPEPTGVAVVSDLMRVAREIRSGSPERVSPFAHEQLAAFRPVSVEVQRRAYYLRFRVKDQPGIIASLAKILADKHISLDAVLQLPGDNKESLPFVITVEPSTEKAIHDAVGAMNRLDFMVEPALALPMETSL